MAHVRSLHPWQPEQVADGTWICVRYVYRRRSQTRDTFPLGDVQPRTFACESDARVQCQRLNPRVRMLLLALALFPCWAAPAAAVPVGDALGLSESLTAVGIHQGGPACSSGWHPDASGQCVSDEDGRPPAWLPVVDPPGTLTGGGDPADPDPVVTPEPGTLLLVGSALAALGWRLRRRMPH